MRLEFFLAVLFAPLFLGCQTSNYTQRGVTTGGLGGAGIGAIIGELAADNPLAGAAIGGSLGALTGATVGAEMDELDAQNRVQQAAYQQAIDSSVTLQEIVSMSSAGLSDEIISRHIADKGYAGTLDANKLISLRQQGVSDRVIAELQSRSTQSVRVAGAATIVNPPVVVHERYHTVPVYEPYCPPYAPWPGVRMHHQRPGFHWGIAFGH